MNRAIVTRRRFAGALGDLALGAPVLVACRAAPAAPTLAPAAAATASESQATKAQAAPGGGKVAMSIATYVSPQREWQRYWAKPSARKSVWDSPEAAKLGTIYQRTLDWMSTVKGPFPMPDNLRYSELEDKWENVSQQLFYGEIPFEEGVQKVQQACQAIVCIARP